MIDNENILDIINKYLLTVNNFNKFFFTNITFYKHSYILENLYIKGLYLINNIFNISLLYLDSLVDIYNLCEKGYIYFIEFINQINITNSYETNSFELTLKDATIFSYKKTIFTLDNNIKTNISEFDSFKLNVINEFIYIINNSSIIFNKNIYNQTFINNYENTEINSKIFLNITSLNKIIKKIISSLEINNKSISIDCNNHIITKLKNINNILYSINNYYYNNKSFYDIETIKNIIVFIEKYINKKYFIKKIDYTFFDDNIKTFDNFDNINNIFNSFH